MAKQPPEVKAQRDGEGGRPPPPRRGLRRGARPPAPGPSPPARPSSSSCGGRRCCRAPPAGTFPSTPSAAPRPSAATRPRRPPARPARPSATASAPWLPGGSLTRQQKMYSPRSGSRRSCGALETSSMPPIVREGVSWITRRETPRSSFCASCVTSSASSGGCSERRAHPYLRGLVYLLGNPREDRWTDGGTDRCGAPCAG